MAFMIPITRPYKAIPSASDLIAYSSSLARKRQLLVDVACSLWKNEFGQEPVSPGDACMKYLGAIPVGIFTGRPLGMESDKATP
jgi:hypothetical protein